MQKKNTRRTFFFSATALFVAIEIALGIALQVTSGRTVAACSFASVILACLFCTLFAKKSADYALTQAALVLTVCADYFLVWSEPQIHLPAMLFFLLAQLCYAARLYHMADRKERRAQWISRTALCLAVLIVTMSVLQEKTDALALVSMLYYANLILNLLFSCFRFRSRAFLAIGFLLFLLCDTVIGLDLMNAYLPIPEDALLYRIIRPGFNLAWMFYLPSQVLLALSLWPSRFENGSQKN